MPLLSCNDKGALMADLHPVGQGSQTPRPRTGTGPRPVKNRAAQQEVSGGQVSKASSATPHHSPSLALLPEPSLTLPAEPPPPPRPWKDCLPRNQSLVPKSLGTTAVGNPSCNPDHTSGPSCCVYAAKLSPLLESLC